jgi:hypothetical protein
MKEYGYDIFPKHFSWHFLCPYLISSLCILFHSFFFCILELCFLFAFPFCVSFLCVCGSHTPGVWVIGIHDMNLVERRWGVICMRVVCVFFVFGVLVTC